MDWPTEDGFWFSFTQKGNIVDYEFFQGNDRLQDGICTLNEMMTRFDEMILKKYLTPNN